MAARAVMVVALLAAGAVACDPGEYPEGLRCASGDRCPAGQVCDVDGVCRRERLAAQADGKAADAEPPSDGGGRPDAPESPEPRDAGGDVPSRADGAADAPVDAPMSTPDGGSSMCVPRSCGAAIRASRLLR